jgi:cell division protein FtsW
MGIRIALRAPDRFGTLVAIGVVVWLVTQAIVNIGAVVGVLPITGIPLPFVSFGGTSLVVGMAAVGLLLQIGRQGRA